MKDISPLFEKRIALWGMGKKGCEILGNIISMGAGGHGILLCDSNCDIQGKDILGHTVLSPGKWYQELESIGLETVAVLVTAASVKFQDEILRELEIRYGQSVEIYTEYAVEWGIYLGLKNSNIDNVYKEKKKLIQQEDNRVSRESQSRKQEIMPLKYFAFLPLHQDEIILIYQIGKVASSTIYNSLLNYRRNVLHCHYLTGIGETEDSLYELLNLKGGKIISLVRDPVARQISEMWESICLAHGYSAEVDFSEIEKAYFPDQFDGGEFDWYEDEMKRVFKIDVFEHPFDKEKGYSVIKQGNIELLLMKTEKVDELENVIGNFLNIEGFRLENNNVGEENAHRFAYREYRENFCLSEDILENIYKKDEHMKHFYSEQERDILYRKWLKGC